MEQVVPLVFIPGAIVCRNHVNDAIVRLRFCVEQDAYKLSLIANPQNTPRVQHEFILLLMVGPHSILG